MSRHVCEAKGERGSQGAQKSGQSLSQTLQKYFCRKGVPAYPIQKARKQNRGKDQHLGFYQKPQGEGKTCGQPAILGQGKAQEEQKQRVDGVCLPPDGGVQQHGRIEKVCGAEKQRPRSGKAFCGFPIKEKAAAQIAKDGGETQKDQVRRGIVADAQQCAQCSHRVEQIQIAGGIICKKIRGIKMPRSQQKHPVGPGGKTGGIIVKAVGEPCGGNTHGECQGKQKKSRSPGAACNMS